MIAQASGVMSTGPLRRLSTEAPVVAHRSGPIDITPDLCAIIDRVQPEGLYLAVGMSGSGFKKGPAIGQCVAEMVLHGESRTVPIPEFRLSRFVRNFGQFWIEQHRANSERVGDGWNQSFRLGRRQQFHRLIKRREPGFQRFGHDRQRHKQQ